MKFDQVVQLLRRKMTIEATNQQFEMQFDEIDGPIALPNQLLVWKELNFEDCLEECYWVILVIVLVFLAVLVVFVVVFVVALVVVVPNCVVMCVVMQIGL